MQQLYQNWHEDIQLLEKQVERPKLSETFAAPSETDHQNSSQVEVLEIRLERQASQIKDQLEFIE